MKMLAIMAFGAVMTAGSLAMAATTDDATANVRESQSYDSLVHGSTSFRDQRIKKECGDISDADLKQQCVSSFGAAATVTKTSSKSKI